VRGRLGTATAEYPLHRRRGDADYPTQSHDDQMDALVKAMRAALEQTAVRGGDVVALALDTTGSSVVPVDPEMQPLSEYYLWSTIAPRKKRRSLRWPMPKNLKRSSGAVGSIRASGLRQIAALPAAQSRQTRDHRQRLRALRHGCRDALRHR
jgi:sugar (pentulose or hexulose) kinase